MQHLRDHIIDYVFGGMLSFVIIWLLIQYHHYKRTGHKYHYRIVMYNDYYKILWRSWAMPFWEPHCKVTLTAKEAVVILNKLKEQQTKKLVKGKIIHEE